MKKMKLDADALSVESFAVGEAKEERGTVAAHMPPPGLTQYTCDPYWHTCFNASLGFTYCGDPCGNTAVQYYTCAQTCVWP